MKKIGIINGPNLNLLGKREPHLYGTICFEDYLDKLKKEELFSGLKITYYQSNHEGGLIDVLHTIGFDQDGIIINAGAYSHTSVAIADAIRAVTSPAIEVHLTNIYAREGFRCNSFIAPVCIGSISGFGLFSYKLALLSLVSLLCRIVFVRSF
jgi:3-dehydroquinate dehydratase II